MGVAPLKIETDRYVKNCRVPVCDRICEFCRMETEDEIHALIRCPLHIDTRAELFSKAIDLFPDFSSRGDTDKFAFLMSNIELCRLVSRTCFIILNNRRDVIHLNATRK